MLGWGEHVTNQELDELWDDLDTDEEEDEVEVEVAPSWLESDFADYATSSTW